MAKTNRKKRVSADKGGAKKKTTSKSNQKKVVKSSGSKRIKAASKNKKATSRTGGSVRVNSDDALNTVKGKAAEIPAFDLGERILAKQRKTASQKRKGPGRKPAPGVAATEASPVPVADTATRTPKPPVEKVASPPEQHLISEIVRRDIKRLRGGH